MFSISDLSVPYLVFKTHALVSILFTLATNLSYKVFLTLFFATGTNLSISNLSTPVFKLAKFDFNAKLKVSICEIFLISVFVA